MRSQESKRAPSSAAILSNKTADILANARRDSDGEARLRGDVKLSASAVSLGFFRAVDGHDARAVGDFHDFRFISTEVIRACVDEAQGFLFTARKENGMGDYFAVEVDICFRDRGYVFEFHS